MVWRTVTAASCFFWLLAADPVQAQFLAGSPLLNAIQNGSPADVRDAVLTGESVHAKSSDGVPAIVLAAHRRNPGIVKTLLNGGARPNDAARDGETALLVASGNGDDEIVVLLLAAKADPDKAGPLRETALLRAVRGRHAAVVKLLIGGGADVNQTDSSGTTPLGLADANHDPQIAGLLKKAGAQ